MYSNRDFFATEGGAIGVGPSDLQIENRICVIFGSNNLSILTKTAKNGRYKRVGNNCRLGYMGKLLRLRSRRM